MQHHSITTFNKMLIQVSQLYTQFAPSEVKNCKNMSNNGVDFRPVKAIRKND